MLPGAAVDLLARLILGWIQQKNLQKWIAFWFGLVFSSATTFLTAFSFLIRMRLPVAGPFIATVLSLSDAGLLAAGVALAYWGGSKFTKGIPVLLPADLLAAAQQMLAEHGGAAAVENRTPAPPLG